MSYSLRGFRFMESNSDTEIQISGVAQKGHLII